MHLQDKKKKAITSSSQVHFIASVFPVQLGEDGNLHQQHAPAEPSQPQHGLLKQPSVTAPLDDQQDPQELLWTAIALQPHSALVETMKWCKSR
jgi:hypothetical protein